MQSHFKDPQFEERYAASGYTYNEQIILNLLSSDMPYGDFLALKWFNQKGKQCHMLSSKDLQNGILSNHDKTGFLRIYIKGYISGDHIQGYDKKFSYVELAKYLAMLIGDQDACVNLISSYASKGQPDDNNSFAAKLHIALITQLQRNINIVARDTNTLLTCNNPQGEIVKKLTLNRSISKNEHDLLLKIKNQTKVGTKKYDTIDSVYKKLFVHHQYGSKKIFFWDKSFGQMMDDAYRHNWKYNVYKYILSAKTNRNDDKGVFLNNWLITLRKKKDNDIYKDLKNAKPYIKQLFADEPNFCEAIENLTLEWERILANTTQPAKRLTPATRSKL